MNCTRKVLGLFSVLAFLGVANAADYKAGEVIVKYKDGSYRTNKTMNALYDAVGAQNVRYYTGLMQNMEQLVLMPNVRVEEAIQELMKSDLVEYAQPNYILSIPKNEMLEISGAQSFPCIPGFEIPGCDPNAKLPCLIPGIPFPPGCEDGGGGGDPGNPGQPPKTRPELQEPPADVSPPVADPDLSKAWGIEKVGSPTAWATHNGAKDFVVAVIDTGIDYNHEDLAFNVWRNPNPKNGDVVGYDFIHNDGLPFDDQGHGTHCSGSIGAVGGNGKGVSGVTQRVSIMGLKFLSSEGSGTTSDAIRAIDYAVENGARVLSNSWGGRGDSNNQALYDSIERAKAKDVLFIAAAGNDGANNDGSNPAVPASFDNDNLIAVAATDKDDGLAYFSNFGKTSTDLGAPGVNVHSTLPNGRYAAFSGTSMAAPHVSGAAALIWSRNPALTYKQVKEVLMSSVDPVASLQGKTVTGGRLNVQKALSSMD